MMLIRTLIVLMSVICSYAFRTYPIKSGRVSRLTRIPSSINELSQGAVPMRCSALKMAEDNSEDGGTEMKYVYAAGVVVFGILWDFFITHGGQPYLVHPQ